MTKMYEPRSVEQLREEVLFLINDLNPGNADTPQIIEKHNNQTLEENIVQKYSFGDCYLFAAVTHLILGCPIVEVEVKGKTIHVLLEIEGQLMDIEGFLTPEQLAKKYDTKKVKIVRDPDNTQQCVDNLTLNLSHRYKNEKPTLDVDIEVIVSHVADSIYYLKPGVFKKLANRRKMVAFMNQFYQELEQLDNNVISQLPCLEVKISPNSKMKMK